MDISLKKQIIKQNRVISDYIAGMTDDMLLKSIKAFDITKGWY